MSLEQEFSRYAKVLEEMCPEQATRASWVDQPYLPASVREFWLAVGVSDLSYKLAPGSPEQEKARSEEGFETWFDDASTRDAWQIDDADQPVPWRYLPPKPRLVRNSREQYLIASDADSVPSLFLFSQSSQRARRLDYSYLKFCCDWLFRWGTTGMTTNVFKQAPLDTKPIMEGLDTDIMRVADGICLYEVKNHPCNTIAYRDIATYTAFVLARPLSEQVLFMPPNGAYFDVKRPKSLPIDPRDPKPLAAFSRHQTHGDEWRDGRCLIGTIADSLVWVEQQLGRGEVRVVCDPPRAEAVRAWLIEHSCNITAARRANLAPSVTY